MKPVQYREALLILNGKVTHQETKASMIVEGLIYVCFSFLPYAGSDEVVVEALNLLGSLLNVKMGRDQLKSSPLVTPDCRVDFLFDCLVSPNVKIRRNAGFVLLNLTSGMDGVQFLLDRGLFHYITKYAPLTSDRCSGFRRTRRSRPRGAFWSTCCTRRLQC